MQLSFTDSYTPKLPLWRGEKALYGNVHRKVPQMDNNDVRSQGCGDLHFQSPLHTHPPGGQARERGTTCKKSAANTLPTFDLA